MVGADVVDVPPEARIGVRTKYSAVRRSLRPCNALVAALVIVASTVPVVGCVPSAHAAVVHEVSPAIGVQPNGLQDVVDHANAGDSIVFDPGVYGGPGVANVRLDKHLTLSAKIAPDSHGPTVWLDGAILYHSAGWLAASPAAAEYGAVVQHSYLPDFSKLRTHFPGSPAPAFQGDQVFVDGTLGTQTLSFVDLQDAGMHGIRNAFFADNAHNMIYLDFSPAGHDIEITNYETSLSFDPGSDGSRMIGIGVRRFDGNDHGANGSTVGSGNNAAVLVNGADAVQFSNDSFYDNATRGLKVLGTTPISTSGWPKGSFAEVASSTFVGNGELGLNGQDSDGIHVFGSRFTNNNDGPFHVKDASGHQGKFALNSESGGAKFVATHYANIDANRFMSNNGFGLHFDISSYMATITDNQILSNTFIGMQFEISDHATIQRNTVTGNGDIGIMVIESSNVGLVANHIEGNGVSNGLGKAGIRIQEGPRHRFTEHGEPGVPNGGDRIRTAPNSVTWDVAGVSTLGNGFYFGAALGEPAPPPATQSPANCYVAAPPPNYRPWSRCVFMIAVDDITDLKGAGAMGVTLDKDHFWNVGTASDQTAEGRWVALWGRQGSDQRSAAYRTLQELQSTTGQEPRGCSPPPTGPCH